MSFAEGETLEILEKPDGDWWIGRGSAGGECGMLPSNYVQGGNQDAGAPAEAEEPPVAVEAAVPADDEHEDGASRSEGNEPPSPHEEQEEDERHSEPDQEEAPPMLLPRPVASAAKLPVAPTVVAPKLPEGYGGGKKVTKVPKMVAVDFEGTETDEISIIEGEQIYLLEGAECADDNYVRVEKLNGVSGIVPRTFIVSRSEYQRMRDEREQAKRLEREQQQAEEAEQQRAAEMERRLESLQVTAAPRQPVRREAEPKSAAASPWSVLKGQIPSQSQSQSQRPSPSQGHGHAPVKVSAESRLWSDRSGKFKVEAEYVALADGKVTLLKTSGGKVTVGLDVLSERDREFVCKRAGVPYAPAQPKSTKGPDGFDWLPFFMSFGVELEAARGYAEGCAASGKSEADVGSFTSESLASLGLDTNNIYKILPEAARRKAKAMQEASLKKHQANALQMVASKPRPAVVPREPLASELVVHGSGSGSGGRGSQALVPAGTADAEEFHERFPTLEELGLDAKSAVHVPTDGRAVEVSGVKVSSAGTGRDNARVVVVQPETQTRELSREIVAEDGSRAMEYLKRTTTSTTTPVVSGSTALAMMQQQVAMQQYQAQAQVQAQVQAQAHAQAQAQYQAQAHYQAQLQAQAQAQAMAQYQAHQAAAAQLARQQAQAQSQPTVQITIHAGDAHSKPYAGNNSMMMSNSPMPQPQMQMLPMMAPSAPVLPMNPYMAPAPTMPNVMYPGTAMPPNPFYPNNNGFGF